MVMADIRPTRADYRIFRKLTTRWNDNDVYGHMNNVVHYALFDTAVNGWLIEEGLLDPQASDTIGLVVETGCKYFAEMRFPDTVHAGIRIGRIESSTVRFEIGLFRNDEQSVTAEGFFIHVYVDRTTRRPIPIDGLRRTAFDALIS
jgi:acyl-CoA thioester hydrolase